MSFDEYVWDSGTCLSLHKKDVAINELVTFLQENSSIKMLDIMSCEIGDEDVKALAQSECLKNLTSLGLSFNKIGAEGAEALAKSEHLTHLTSLDLTYNKIGAEGVKALAKSEYLTHLTSLDLTYNKIGAEGAEALAKSEHLKNLTSLDLSSNKIGAEGAEALAKSERLKDLTSLSLGSNKIGNVGLKAFGGALKSDTLPKLKSLNLGSNEFGDEGLKELSGALKNGKFPELQKLDLGWNEFGDVGLHALGKALEGCKITTLELNHMKISGKGVKALVDGNKFKQLEVLYLGMLRNDSIGSVGIAALTEGLEKGNFPKLKHLSFPFRGTRYSGNPIKILKDAEANRVAQNTMITCGVITALAVGIGCGVAGTQLSILAIAGIAIAAALVVGVLAGVITYVALTPNSKLDNLNSEQLNRDGMTV